MICSVPFYNPIHTQYKNTHHPVMTVNLHMHTDVSYSGYLPTQLHFAHLDNNCILFYSNFKISCKANQNALHYKFTHSHTLVAVTSLQGATCSGGIIIRNLGFSILLRDTLTCRLQGGLGIQPSTFRSLQDCSNHLWLRWLSSLKNSGLLKNRIQLISHVY